MSTGDAPSLREEFDRLLPLEPAARAPLLERLATRDPALAEELAALLRHADSERQLLDRTPVGLPSSPAVPEHHAGPTLEAGARVGRYTIVRVLGWGGMGVVYEAEQEFPQRRVALKLVRGELVTMGLLRRFEHEAAVLGRLQHPGIAQIYEAGAAKVEGEDRPFIAMEIVRGRTLLEHAREERLGDAARLELLAQIADAVQHAHQRGVIHRDLKPANVIVEADGSATGRPKVLDFGVARLADDTNQGVTRATFTGQIIGTLDYMSPEQASGDPTRVDSRSDVYALGAMLYELLCGKPPLDLGALGVAEALRRIAAIDPPRPARVRGTLRGDVETILTRALEKDPAARYQNASDLAGDIRRHLRDEPVTARPPSAMYQLAKFARRNRPVVFAAVAVALALVVGVAGVVVGLVRAREQAARAERLNRYMRSMLALEPDELRSKDKSALKEMLDVALANAESLASDPAAQGSALSVVGNAYFNFGFPRDARPPLARALTLLEGSLGPDHPDTLYALDALAATTTTLQDDPEVESLLRRALGARRRAHGPDDRQSFVPQQNLAIFLTRVGRLDEARDLLTDLVARQRRVLGAADPDTIRSLGSLGGVEREAHRDNAARACYQEACDLARASGQERTYSGIGARYGLATLDVRARDYERAIPELERVVVDAREVLGPAHMSIPGFETSLAQALIGAGRSEEALAVADRAIAESRRIFGDGLETLAPMLVNAAVACKDLGRFEDALQRTTLAVDLLRQQRPEGSPVLGGVLIHHAESLRFLGRDDEEAGALEEAYREFMHPARRRPAQAGEAAAKRAALASRVGDEEAAETWRALQAAADQAAGASP